MTTSIIILIIFVVVMIIDMVVQEKHRDDEQFKRETFQKSAMDVLFAFKDNFSQSVRNTKTNNTDFIEQLETTSNLNRKLIEDFVELSDSEYKRTIKQLMAEKDNAVAMHLQLITAIRSLSDNDRKKIQARLDKMTGLKNGKERRVPATKNKDGGK